MVEKWLGMGQSRTTTAVTPRAAADTPGESCRELPRTLDVGVD